MPIKGDDLDSLTAIAVIDHLSNKTATYKPKGLVAPEQSVKGIFSKDFADVGGTESNVPMFVCKESDIPNVRHRDMLEFGNIEYWIVGVEPDGIGLVTLLLEEI